MKTFKTVLLICALALMVQPFARAQFATSGSTTLGVTVYAEAALRVDTADTTLATSGALFTNDYTGATSFTYKVRTTKSGGTGNIQLKVLTDFSGNGPSVASPRTAGDALAYTCASTGVGGACSGSQTSSTSNDTPVVSFGPNTRSSKAGDSGSVSWTLTNDPLYETGSYTATVQFTISAA
jgi:hypothetical protein